MLNIPNEGIDLYSIHVIQLLQSFFDLSLIALDITYEHQRIVLLNFLHRALSVQRVDDDLMMIQAGLMRDRFARVFWRSGKLEGLRSMESGGEADFTGFFGVDLEEGPLGKSPLRNRGGQFTPLSAAFDAALALALCFPPMGATKTEVSSCHTSFSRPHILCVYV